MSLYIVWMFLATFIAIVAVGLYYLIYARNINKKICDGKSARKRMIEIPRVIIIAVIAVLVSYSVILSIENMQLRNVANSQIQEERIKGNWFQQTYGSIGVVNQYDYNLVLTLYCFDEKIDFLDDKENLQFDNDTVKIKDIKYEVQYEEKELIVYSVYINVAIDEKGQHDVKELVYEKNGKAVSYPFGTISFVSVTGDVIGLYGECDTSITNGEWGISISGKNEDAFTINDCIFASQDKLTYTYEKDISFEPGNELLYFVKVDANTEDGDRLIMTPIFELSMAHKKYYYSPGVLMCDEKRLSYDEIKEYVSQ